MILFIVTCAKQPYPKEQKRNETGDFIKVPWWDEPADTDTIEKYVRHVCIMRGIIINSSINSIILCSLYWA